MNSALFSTHRIIFSVRSKVRGTSWRCCFHFPTWVPKHSGSKYTCHRTLSVTRFSVAQESHSRSWPAPYTQRHRREHSASFTDCPGRNAQRNLWPQRAALSDTTHCAAQERASKRAGTCLFHVDLTVSKTVHIAFQEGATMRVGTCWHSRQHGSEEATR